MIRINLLEVRPRSAEGLDSILSSGRSSTFISRREAILGALFLILTVSILGMLAASFSSEDEGTDDVAARAEEAASGRALVTSPEPGPAPSAPVVDEPAPETPTPAPLVQLPPQERTSAPPPAAPPEANTTGRTITAVTATPLADRVDVFVEMSDAPAVTRFRVDDPPRLVFDIPSTQLVIPNSQRTQQVDSPLVSRMRIAQYTLEPPVVRLVLEVGDAPTKADVSTSSAGLSIRVMATK